MDPVSVESSPVRSREERDEYNEYSLGLERAPRKPRTRFYNSDSDSDSDAESVEPRPITPRNLNLLPAFQTGFNFEVDEEQTQQPVRTISGSMSMSSLTLSNIEESKCRPIPNTAITSRDFLFKNST